MKQAEHIHKIGIEIYDLKITGIGIVFKVSIPSIGIGIEIVFHLAEVLVSVSKFFLPNPGIGIGIENIFGPEQVLVSVSKLISRYRYRSKGIEISNDTWVSKFRYRNYNLVSKFRNRNFYVQFLC
ncbi:MAG: hypothetical protein GY821_11705 [Gammaproteobacteria bacterium]|nr:hypothetical protein [Gammaproteobacteria bacterium]